MVSKSNKEGFKSDVHDILHYTPLLLAPAVNTVHTSTKTWLARTIVFVGNMHVFFNKGGLDTHTFI